MSSTVCPDCGAGFSQLGKHLTGSCEVSLSDKEKELLDALIIGDGSIDNGGSGNHRLTVTTTEPDYAAHIENELEWLHGSTRMVPSEELKDSKKDQYIIRTPCLEYLTKQRNRWYRGGQKRIPNDFDVTPTTLKHWICADGHLDVGDKTPRYKIGCSLEQDRRYFIESLFPFTTVYVGYEICFSAHDTGRIMEFMGEAPPGFEYKWPNDYTEPGRRRRKPEYLSTHGPKE